MPKVKAPCALCLKCPLRNEPFAKPTGSRTPKAILVGEAPGANEAKEGSAFVGQSGRLLNKILTERFGLSRDDVYVTNTVLCRPPDNRVPTQEEVNCCKPRLYAELQAIDAPILTLGSTALNTLLPAKETLTRRRGRWYKWGQHDLLPTFHPAYILRNGGALNELESDMAKVLKPTSSAARTFRWELFSNKKAADKKLRELMAQTDHTIVLDLETTGLNPQTDNIVLIAVCVDDQYAMLIDCDMSHSLTLKHIVETSGFIGHNAKFDALFLKERYGWNPKIADDTMMMHYVLDERKGTHGLKELAAQFCNAPDYSKEVAKLLGAETANIDRQKLAEYAAQDVYYTYKLFEIFVVSLSENPRQADLYTRIVLPTLNLYVEIEHNGMLLDKAKCKELDLVWSQQLAQLQTKLGDLNPNSPKQIKDILYKQRKLPMQYTKDGKETTNADALENLLAMTGDPFLRDLLDYRALAKMHGTYAKGLLEAVQADGRVHSTFLLHGTITGRPSSQEPNMLNIPRSGDEFGKAIKDLFVAPKGYQLVQADYSQQEIRVLAFYANDPVLQEIFRTPGADVHREVAKKIFATSDPTKEQRVAAKRVVFGQQH